MKAERVPYIAAKSVLTAPANALWAAAFVLVFAAGAHAQTAPMAPQGAAAPAASMTEGEVRKVDGDAGTVTLRHGPIVNLEMPGMTMVFKAADPKMLQNLKEGDKVRFTVERVGGALAVTRIETMK